MKEKLVSAFTNLLDSAISAAPKVVVGIVLMVVGVMVAKIIEMALRFILTRIRFDSLIERAGIDKTLHRIGLRQQLNSAIPRIVYFLTLIVLARTAADGLGLTAISGAIGAFFAYLPNIIAALLLLIVGTAVAQFASETIVGAAKGSGIDFAPALGKLVSGLIMFVVGMMAIGQLQIDTNMVRIVTSFILGAGALAFGLAFGLGTRDVVRNITAGFYLRKHAKFRQSLEIAGQKGVLTLITATHTILEDGSGHDIAVANATFLDQISKQDRPTPGTADDVI
jgi:Conserved TM helix/Mechanosensitive ion channel